MIDLIRSRRTEFEKCMQDTVDLVSKSAEHVEHAKQSLSVRKNIQITFFLNKFKIKKKLNTYKEIYLN